MPGLSPAIIRHLLVQAVLHAGRILIPTLSGRRGHPVLLPWPLAAEISRLRDDEGLNVLIAAQDPLFVACDMLAAPAETAFADVDTPADWDRYHKRQSP
jgi:molybdenum cofactor cytidylyltransferase